MTYTPANDLRYASSQPQPVYPPFLSRGAGYPAGQAAFGPAEPGHPTMLPGYPVAPITPVPAVAPTAPAVAPVAQAAYEEPRPSSGVAPSDAYGQSAQPDSTQPQSAQPQPAPSYGQPGYGQYAHPGHGRPAHDQSSYGQSSYGQPSYGQPGYGQPGYGQPSQPGQAQPGYAQPQQTPTGYAQPGYARPQQQVGDLSAHEQAYAAYHQGQASQQQSPSGRAAGRPARRPRVLSAAVWFGVIASGLTVASQALAITTGRAAVESAIAKELPAGAEQFTTIIGAAVDEAYRTIQTRAVLAIGLSVVVAVLVALCLRAGLVARIMAVIAMAATGLLLMVCLIDVYPSTARLVGLPALLLFPVTAALLFMPAVGRYRTSRSRRAQVGAPLGTARG